MRGRAFVFGDEINTDLIIKRKDYRGVSAEEAAKHVFKPIRPDFVDEMEPGDVVVAGDHFGSGSARAAPTYIKLAGVSAVLAESFSRIYYRNSIATGMPAFIAPGITDAVDDGDDVEIDQERNVVVNHTTGEEHPYERPPDRFQDIFEAGGLLESLTAPDASR